MANFSSGVSTPSGTKPRINLNELRRPPSRSTRPQSPRLSNTIRSRPGSAMGSLAGSRPTTPSARVEPYTGTITVSIRPNPFSVAPGQASPWQVNPYENTITNTSDISSFNFDNVFVPDHSISNREVYNRTCANIVHKFLYEGYNGTVFAYGMTGSGKTYSMKGTDDDSGFVNLAIDEVFQKIDSDKFNKEYNISITYLEIYNERIIDLLQGSAPGMAELKIRDDPIYGTKIIGITTPVITSKEQLLQLIKKGDNNRKTSATDFNARSSRSHSILQIKISTIDLSTNTEQSSTLSLCDLAGSERATSSLERRKEGSFINKSLLALSTVINKLSLASGNSSPGIMEHIPYRDSKLTRLLQPALSGSSLILILCTIHMGSPGTTQQFVSETYNTLRFAARAKDVVMNVQQNKSSSFGNGESLKLIEELKKTIENQKNEMMMLKLNGYSNPGESSISGELNVRLRQVEADNRILTEKLEHFTRLTDLQKTETIILKNDTLNDILGSGADSSQVMMANLEDFYKRVNYEMDEYKSYIEHLENQLKFAHQLNLLRSPVKEESSDRQLQAVLKDQEEEILQLKEQLKDKDHLIKSLSKTSKLRRLVDSNSTNSPSNQELPFLLDHKKTDRTSDKENSYTTLRQFKISPTKN